MTDRIDVVLEVGAKRTFATAVDWPGWSRSGRDGDGALAALGDYRERYADVLRPAHIRPPAAGATFEVAARVDGGSGTDFGVPSVPAPGDDEPVDGDALDRQIRFLTAAWRALDRAIDAAQGVELAKGPRGGGRDLTKIAGHVVESEASYIGALGAGAPKAASDPFAALEPIHAAAVEALHAKARGELADVGARGGRRWSARYFVRRAAWHVLDHAWEIEDRSDRGDRAS